MEKGRWIHPVAGEEVVIEPAYDNDDWIWTHPVPGAKALAELTFSDYEKIPADIHPFRMEYETFDEDDVQAILKDDHILVCIEAWRSDIINFREARLRMFGNERYVPRHQSSWLIPLSQVAHGDLTTETPRQPSAASPRHEGA